MSRPSPQKAKRRAVRKATGRRTPAQRKAAEDRQREKRRSRWVGRRGGFGL